MGTSNTLIEDNLIEWCGWADAERGWEAAGAKFHGARNLLFRRNVVRHMRKRVIRLVSDSQRSDSARPGRPCLHGDAARRQACVECASQSRSSMGGRITRAWSACARGDRHLWRDGIAGEQRRREIGIRMALGALPSQAIRLVVLDFPRQIEFEIRTGRRLRMRSVSRSLILRV